MGSTTWQVTHWISGLTRIQHISDSLKIKCQKEKIKRGRWFKNVCTAISISGDPYTGKPIIQRFNLSSTNPKGVWPFFSSCHLTLPMIQFKLDQLVCIYSDVLAIVNSKSGWVSSAVYKLLSLLLLVAMVPLVVRLHESIKSWIDESMDWKSF
jgi:hypothetical protein